MENFDVVSYMMGARAGGGSSSSDVYKPGDTIDLSGYIYGVGTTSGDPARLVITFIMPKTNTNTLPITHNLSAAWIRGGGNNYSGSISVVSMTGNVLSIVIAPSGSTLPANTVLSSAIAGVITFGEPPAEEGE